jgi:electron transfer flavoprotein alpha subunit
MQHLAGCANARTIVAINTDPDAPIFEKAHFGIVGDFKKVLPALTAACRELRQS